MGLLIIVYIVSFFSVGLWLGLLALKYKLLPKEFLLVASVAASLAIYYALFYIYLLNPLAGRIVCLLIMSLSVPVAVSLLKMFLQGSNSSLIRTTKSYYLTPLLIMVAIFIPYAINFSSCTIPQNVRGATYKQVDNKTFCSISNLPIDNALPFIYGDYTLQHNAKGLVGDWKLVDRPPLQMAAVLPILDFSKHSSTLERYAFYYLFAIFLQLSWVAAVWGILKTLKISDRFIRYIVILFALTGFFYLNSIFVWPKLLAAALTLTGIAVYLGVRPKQFNFRYLPFVAIVVSLGLLSHGGVIFTIIPFVLLIICKMIRSENINISYIIIALLSAILLLSPWILYKGAVSKSDRLIKYQFAGVTSAADTRSTVQTIVDQYKTLSFSVWLSYKKQNVKTLVTGDSWSSLQACPLNKSSIINKCFSIQWRTITFFSTLFGLEAVNLGWLALVYGYFKKELDRIDWETLGIILASLVIWVVSMFEPGSTIIHQGSYATMILLFIILARSLARFPSIVLLSTTILQAFIFYFAWISAFYK